jgi:catechol 2,3-dioxygenase-like lactoylglutathione lyase family enzyme
MTEHHNDPGPEASLTVHGLDHFALAVRSVDASRKWYQDWFGLKPVQTDPDVFVPYVSNGEVRRTLPTRGL